MEKWMIARYLIDAKKNIDSMMYIEQHISDLANISIQEFMESIYRQFYLSCCYILDNFCEGNAGHIPVKEYKKRLCKNNDIIDAIYYERDKNIGHKDEDYKTIKETIIAKIERMKNQLEEVFKTCKKQLPPVLTLDYVAHDKLLFRFVNNINPTKEREINRKKYPLNKYNENENCKLPQYTLIHNIDDIKDIPKDKKNNYCVEMKAGINMLEGLQDRQDACIKINLLFGHDMWTSMNYKSLEFVERLKSMGYYNQYDMPDEKTLSDVNQLKKCVEMMENSMKENNQNG